MNSDQLQRAKSDHHLAKVALASGRADIAQLHITASLKNNPHNTEARLTQTQITLEQNQPQNTTASPQSHPLDTPEPPHTLPVAILRARTLVNTHKDHLAKPLLEQLIEQNPKNASPRRLLVTIHLRNNQTEAAIEQLSQLVKINSNDFESLQTLIDLLASTNPKACLSLMQAHDLDFGTAPHQLQMARLHVRFEELCEAEMIYRRLIARQPKDSQIQLEAGQLAASQGDHALAIKRLETASESDTLAFESLTALALVYMYAGRFTTAGRCWWRATRLAPCDAQPWAGLLLCAMNERRHTLATRASDKLTERTNKQTRRMILATLWPGSATGNIIQQAVRPSTLDQVATATPLQMLLDHATRTLAQHTHDHPQRADTHYHLAVCQEATGQFTQSENNTNQAMESISAALKINPTYTSAKAFCTRLLQRAA